MSDYTIEISPQSKIIIFQGTLKKAPQLNKRGRKKWKDRFIVLRACKTLECFKSKKALDACKSPRKVIDIRECINLEVGLEYKELQHIFSLGTFKRSFFFAAPSDALMLQWVDNIEKVKNALHGDRIRVLDIGLRKSPMRTTANMCNSHSMSRIATMCSSTTAINQVGVGSTMGRDFLSDGERSPSLPPPPSQAPPNDLTSSFTSFSSQSSFSPQHKKSDDTSPSHRRGHYYVNVAPVKVRGHSSQSPPAVSKTSPEHHKYSDQNATKSFDKTTPTNKGIEPAKRPHPHSLPRGSPQHVIHGKIPPPKIASRGSTPAGTPASTPPNESNPFASLIQHTQQVEDMSFQPLEPVKQVSNSPQGMRRSFRYRQITLRKEKPVFGHIDEEDDSSDETDRETSIERGVAPAMTTPTQLPPSSLYHQKSMTKSSPNLSEIGRPKAGRIKNCAVRPNYMTNQNGAIPPPVRKGSLGVVPFNAPPNYSKVTVVGVKVQNYNDVVQAPPPSFNRSSNMTETNLTVDVRCRTSGRVSRGSSLRNSISDGALCSPLPENLYLPDPLSDDEDELPNRYSSDHIFDSTSVSSLDALVVAPPLMFNDNNDRNSQIQEGNCDLNSLKDKKKDEEEESVVANRSSTESCDTGYTSSPTYNKKNEKDDSTGKWSLEVDGTCLPHSATSERTCVPLVFYSENVWKPNLLKSSSKEEGLISVQVCLVEQCKGLMEDFLSLKSIEGYKHVESEVEQGPNAVTTPTSDILTMETSLEDLEFGFKVVRSTQKDLFQKKVKVFDFELENLFNKKEFSCDVQIKCLSDTVVIPIEFELK